MWEAVTKLFPDNPWFVVLIAASPTVGSGVWVLWRWLTERTDKREEAHLSREALLDKRQAEMDADRSRAFSELRADNASLREELEKRERELERKQRDLLRGWDLARWWHGAAHDVLRSFRNLRHNALNMQLWINAAVRRHGIEMPQTIEPVPDRIDLPMGLEEPK